jgi:hypothetical protein
MTIRWKRILAALGDSTNEREKFLLKILCDELDDLERRIHGLDLRPEEYQDDPGDPSEGPT